MRRFAARPLLALAVAAMGIVDLLSALLSPPPERVRALRPLVPTDVLDTSRTFTLLAGALLLLTANGLRRGKRRAFVTALFLCALSVPENLLKAGDVEEATPAPALMFMLGLNAEAFVVKSRELSWRTLRGPAVAAIVAIGIYAFGGCWLLAVTNARRLPRRRPFAVRSRSAPARSVNVRLVSSTSVGTRWRRARTRSGGWERSADRRSTMPMAATARASRGRAANRRMA